MARLRITKSIALPELFAATALAMLLASCGGGGSQNDASSSAGTGGTTNGTSPAQGTPPVSVPGNLPPSATDLAWSNPASWGGTLPKDGDVIVIPAGRRMLLDVDTPRLRSLTIQGELIFADKDLALTADWIWVNGGKLEAGRADRPYVNKAVITLTGAASTADIGGMGTKFLGVTGGQLVMHGELDRTSWTRLSATAEAGARDIKVNEAAKWRVGDEIVITSTDFDAAQAEVRQITAVNGTTLSLNQPLTHKHNCVTHTYSGKSLQQCAEVGLLTRNIRIQGDAQSATAGFGGHAMVMAGGKAMVQGVEFKNVGQTGVLGRYGFHWHMVGAASGQYIKDCAIRDVFHKGLVVHGTDDVLVERCVVHNTIGHNVMFAEDGVEKNNTFRSNLAVLARPKPRDKQLITSDQAGCNFWGQNPNNHFINNVAAGSTHGCGYWFELTPKPTGLSANVNLNPREQPFGTFSGNVAHSNAHKVELRGNNEAAMTAAGTGLFIERHLGGTLDTGLNRVVGAKIVDFTSYANHTVGAWGDFNVQFDGLRLADNAVGTRTIAGQIKNALVIGLSGTVNVSPWAGRDGRDPLNGFVIYDGWSDFENVTFANFRDTAAYRAGAIGTVGGKNFTAPNNTFKDVDFVNANEGSVVRITGTQFDGTRAEDQNFVVDVRQGGSFRGAYVFDQPLLRTASCGPIHDNVRFCPHEYVALGTRSMRLENSALPYTFVRADGARYTSRNDFFFGAMNVLGNTSYQLSAANANAFAAMHFDLTDQSMPTTSVTLSYPFPWPNVFASSGPAPKAYDLLKVVPDGPQPVVVDSLAAMNAAANSAVYLDRATQTLHVKLANRARFYLCAQQDCK